MSRNVYNEKIVTLYCRGLGAGKERHIEVWWTSIFRRWLLNDCKSVRRLMVHTEESRAIAKYLMSQKTGERLATWDWLPIESPTWALKAAVSESGLWEVKFPLVEALDITHIQDFLLTLPKRPIRYTVPDLMEAVKVWDKQLERQKLDEECEAGLIFCAVLPGEFTDHAIYRLDNEAAFKREGALMKNCVANYANRDKTKVFSIRKYGESTPVADVEVHENYGGISTITQIKGPMNAEVGMSLHKAIVEWGKSLGYTYVNRSVDEEMIRQIQEFLGLQIPDAENVFRNLYVDPIRQNPFDLSPSLSWRTTLNPWFTAEDLRNLSRHDVIKFNNIV